MRGFKSDADRATRSRGDCASARLGLGKVAGVGACEPDAGDTERRRAVVVQRDRLRGTAGAHRLGGKRQRTG